MMQIENTSDYATPIIRKLVRFAVGDRDIGSVNVRVTNCRRGFRGRAWRSTNEHGARRVLLRIGPPECFPIHGLSYRGLVTAPSYDLRDWQEALVSLAAHEFTHIVQFRTLSPCSEIEAEHSALVTLERFRVERAVVVMPEFLSMPARRVVIDLIEHGVTSCRPATARVLEREKLARVVGPHPWTDSKVIVTKP